MKGFTLMETVLAVAMLSILAIAIFPTLGLLIQKSTLLRYDTQAAAILQEGMEVVYNVAAADWDTVAVDQIYHPAVEAGTGMWTLLPGEQTVEAKYVRQITVSPVCRQGEEGRWEVCGEDGRVDARSKLIRGEVRWQERGNDRVINAELLIVKL